mmetsp:Transcript_38153/g.58178  ORF Transcript_38153/g.58178 Transcript_38153/m.58178 type:complete len:251 (-) Transcript_38153:3794-4546(-)
MIEEVAKIDMEELPVLFIDHEVSGMTISDSKGVGSHALPSQTLNEVTVHLLHLLVGVLHGFQDDVVIWVDSELAPLFRLTWVYLTFGVDHRESNDLLAFFKALVLLLVLELLQVLLEDGRVHFILEILIDTSFFEGASPEPSPFMHRGNNFRVVYKLDVAYLVASLQHFVADNLHVHVLLHPHFVHDPEELEDQVILAEIISVFEQDLNSFNLLFIILILSTNFSDQEQRHLFTHEEAALFSEFLNMLLG